MASFSVGKVTKDGSGGRANKDGSNAAVSGVQTMASFSVGKVTKDGSGGPGGTT